MIRRSLIWKKNEGHNHTKIHLTLALKISIKLKITTNIIKHLGGKSTKLYNKSSLEKITFYERSFKNSARIMQMNFIIYWLMSNMTWIKWRRNKAYVHKCSCFVGRNWISLNRIKIKMKIIQVPVSVWKITELVRSWFWFDWIKL